MVTAILLAAGKSLRFIKGRNKVLFKICGKPVIYYSLLALSRHPKIDEIIVVSSLETLSKIKRLIKGYRINKVSKVILGGKERKDSVSSGLKELSLKTSLVVIHDAARPFINSKIITDSILAAKKRGAAVVGVPLKYTVKEVSKGFVVRTLKREDIWEIQTPQVFKKEIILKAYKNKLGYATDDAVLVEKMGIKPVVVLGSYSNLKITTFEDIFFAEAILKGNLL
ncbi:MAG: 2-C-methyl-D-erythritol 4-phosphate cytidylyltransferase [Candidatus Omnitrophota bacterium]